MRGIGLCGSMTRRLVARLLLLLAFAALAPAAPAHAQRVSMLPPDIDDGYTTGFLAMFREPPLWVSDAARGYRSRIRVSLMANFDLQVSLRIDERDDGRLVGTAVRVRRGSRPDLYSVRGRTVTRFPVSRKQLDELEQALAGAGTWKFARGAWGTEQDRLCIDGLVMIFERADADGYRHAEANAACETPPALQAATRLWLRIAGVEFPWPWRDVAPREAAK